MTGDVTRWLNAALKASGFLARYPFYAYLIARFRVVDDPRIEVMGVSGEAGEPTLHVNRAFFEASPRYLPGVVLHEIHHVVLGHLSDPRFRTAAHRQAMVIAMELSANEDIQEPLPGTPYRLASFAHLGIAPRQSTWARYERLAHALPDGEDAPIPIDDHSRWREADRAGGLRGTASSLANQAVATLLEGALESTAAGGRSGLTVAERTPGALLAEGTAFGRPHLDWRRLIRQFAARLGGPGYRYGRPNRRFPEHIGQVPGRSRHAGRQRPRLLAVIDTSGSMDVDTLAAVAIELDALSHLVEVIVVECDAAIQRVYPARGVPGTLKGRGGTDLRPPFEPTFLRHHRPDGVVYFTDGDGPYPAAPPLVPTLWVLAGESPFPCTWGAQVRLRRATARNPAP